MSSPDAGFSTLLPASQIPPREAFLARADTFSSDIFPDTYPERNASILGDYLCSGLPGHSPLQPLMGTLVARRNRLNAQERQNGYIPTDETESGLSAVELQMYLVKCIDKGYRNIYHEAGSPEASFPLLTAYIEERDELSYARYTAEIDTLVSDQAQAERQIGFQVINSQYRQVGLRLERLRFEWLSARAIEETMRRAIDALRGLPEAS
jgi:hypothetical protein